MQIARFVPSEVNEKMRRAAPTLKLALMLAAKVRAKYPAQSKVAGLPALPNTSS